jgi:hypothetical protein
MTHRYSHKKEDPFFRIDKILTVKFGSVAALIYSCVDDEAIINWDYKAIQEKLPFLSEDWIGANLGNLPRYLKDIRDGGDGK